jgi:C4-dicarboxylate-specific signal transduction histidine kinase
MGVSLDITDRLNAEAEARQQWEQLAHVTRIGIMGELTASLAHEINQPLTAIQSNAEAAQRFLSRSEPDIDEVRQILVDIVRDDTRASDIIRKIRALLKREAAAFAVLGLNDLIRDVLSLLRADSLLRELVITDDLFAGLPPVSADRIQIQQVIINLILNGAAAMKNSPPDRRKLILKTAIQEDRTVRVSVADFGTGVDESAIERLFEPFYTTKSEGLGMGLAISQTIINAHGGTLEASNNPEGGATFAFTLPAYQGEPA